MGFYFYTAPEPTRSETAERIERMAQRLSLPLYIGTEPGCLQKHGHFPLKLFPTLLDLGTVYVDHRKCCQLNLTAHHRQFVTLRVHVSVQQDGRDRRCIMQRVARASL